MRFLLDTHVFLWATSDPDRLGAQRALIADPEHERLVSAVVPWELAIKAGRGRLTLPEPVGEFVRTRLPRLVATALPITLEHAAAVEALPPHHRDPFDRLLIAQAQMLEAPIVTVDPAFAAYDVELLHP